MAVLISSDLFAIIPFIFAVRIMETLGHTKSNITSTLISCFHHVFFFKVNHFYWPTYALNLNVSGGIIEFMWIV